jgi:hypothetical protein
MNQRMKQLAEQAGYLPDMFGIGHWDMPECKKFAQLIVQECAELVDGRTFLYAGNTIREHFGIEE